MKQFFHQRKVLTSTSMMAALALACCIAAAQDVAPKGAAATIDAANEGAGHAESAKPTDNSSSKSSAKMSPGAGHAERPNATDAEIAAWVADLDSNRYLVREQATQQLLGAGAAVMDPLVAVANGERPEPAERAVWVLKRLGESDDPDVASGALSRLTTVARRPAVVREAKQALDRLSEVICQRSLSTLGGRLTVIEGPMQDFGQIRMIRLELDDNWKGTPNDLSCLAKLAAHRYFRLEGAAIGDTEIKVFQSMDELALLQLFRTRVSVDAVDELKQRQPKAIVYVRNRALLGIMGATNEKGVAVTNVPGGTGAAAAGLAVNDVITTMDGRPVKDFDRLTAHIGQHEPGEKVELTILRGEEKLTKRVTLGMAPNLE